MKKKKTTNDEELVKKELDGIHKTENKNLGDLAALRETETENASIFDHEPLIISDDGGLKNDLKTIKKLADFGITIGGPDFLNLGNTFVAKFDRLKLLHEVEKSQAEITNSPYEVLDKELASFLDAKFTPKKSNPLEGNIRNILQEIADNQKVSIYDASLMVKPGKLIFLLAKGAIIKKGKDIMIISTDKLAGKSEIISSKNINNAFEADAKRLNTKDTFNYIIKIDNVSDDIICSLFYNGSIESVQSLKNWLSK